MVVLTASLASDPSRKLQPRYLAPVHASVFAAWLLLAGSEARDERGPPGQLPTSLCRPPRLRETTPGHIHPKSSRSSLPASCDAMSGCVCVVVGQSSCLVACGHSAHVYIRVRTTTTHHDRRARRTSRGSVVHEPARAFWLGGQNNQYPMFSSVVTSVA